MKGSFLVSICSILFFFLLCGTIFGQNFLFESDLSLGKSSPEVKELQKHLNRFPETQISASGPGSPGNETDYFGYLTKSALAKYQEKYKNEILIPAGLDKGTGYLGALTRKHINSSYTRTDTNNSYAYPAQTSTSPNATIIGPKPIISSVYPTHAMEGTEITLSGTGFTDNNTVYASFNKLENIASSDGKTIKFIVKEPFPDDLEVPDFIREKYKSMQYGFYVKNKNGYSNTVMFTLDLIKQ